MFDNNLGGLGPNTHTDDWLLRKQKVEKQ